MSRAASGTTNPLFGSEQLSGTRQAARCLFGTFQSHSTRFEWNLESIFNMTLTESICMLILNHLIPQLMERNIWSNFGYFMQMKCLAFPVRARRFILVAAGLQKWNLWIFLKFSKWRIQSNESIWNICYRAPPTLVTWLLVINSLRITQSIKRVIISRPCGRRDIFDIFPIVCGWQ